MLLAPAPQRSARRRSISPRPFASQRENDVESSLMHYRARSYDPRIGRFLQSDPELKPAIYTHYAYARNNPVMLVDPSGFHDLGYGWPGSWSSAFGGYLGVIKPYDAKYTETWINPKDLGKRNGAPQSFALGLAPGGGSQGILRIRVRLNFTFPNNWSTAQQNTFLDDTKHSIDSLWSGAILVPKKKDGSNMKGFSFPQGIRIVFELETYVERPSVHAAWQVTVVDDYVREHFVSWDKKTVLLGKDAASEPRTFLTQPEIGHPVVAHEFGHILGLGDEYQHAPFGSYEPGYESDSHSIMNAGRKVRSRHLQHFGKWVTSVMKNYDDAEYVPNQPEK